MSKQTKERWRKEPRRANIYFLRLTMGQARARCLTSAVLSKPTWKMKEEKPHLFFIVPVKQALFPLYPFCRWGKWESRKPNPCPGPPARKWQDQVCSQLPYMVCPSKGHLGMVGFIGTIFFSFLQTFWNVYIYTLKTELNFISFLFLNSNSINWDIVYY